MGLQFTSPSLAFACKKQSFGEYTICLSSHQKIWRASRQPLLLYPTHYYTREFTNSIEVAIVGNAPPNHTE